MDLINDYNKMLEYGVINRRGPRNNQTDCEVDIILIHIPSKTVKRFNGNFYDERYEKAIYEWIIKHQKININDISVKDLLYFNNESLYDIYDMGKDDERSWQKDNK